MSVNLCYFGSIALNFDRELHAYYVLLPTIIWLLVFSDILLLAH